MSGIMDSRGRRPFRHSFALVTFLTLLPWGGPILQAAENNVSLADNLTNGDFEEAMEMTPTNAAGATAGAKVVSAAGWTTLIGNLPQVITWGNDPKEAPKKGGRFLRIKDDSPNEPVAVESTRAPAQGGQEYGASIWVRTQDKGDPALYLNFYDDKGKRLTFKVGQAAQSGPYPDWTYLRAQQKAPRGTATVSIALFSYPRDVGTYDFDDGMMGAVGPASAPLPDVAPAPAREENMATVLNWQGKSTSPTSGVAAPVDRKAKEPAPVPVPTTAAVTASEVDSTATARKIIAESENPAAQPAAPAKKVAVSDAEKKALGIEPLPPIKEGASGMRAKPKPNDELPPPWILPSDMEKKP